ncbi:FH2 domain-containing protein 1-like [Ixodes scapularis]
MELRGGLDYVLQHPEHTRTLAAALASGDASVRQQVWQLLASLCTHGEGEGLRRALSTLEQLAALQGQRGRLAPLAHALAQPAAPQAALLTLANCALSSRDRARLRAELRARGVKVPPALGSSPAPTTPAPSKDSPLASSPALHRQALATLASLAAAGPNREAQLLRLLERLPTLADDAWEKLGAAEPTTRCDCTRQQAAAKETRARQDELLELLAASPAPRVKMRSLNWTKIPAHKVLSGPNLWRRVAQSQSRPPELDFGHLEGLFCQPPEGTWPRTAVSRTGDPPGRTEAGEVRLLDAQRSLHLGIFLKQLRGQVSEGFLLELLSRGSGGQLKLGAERVRSLLALLPASEAASQLEKALADAEPALLAPPEAFLARLLRLPNYRLRIESLLLQEELPSVVASLESSMTCLRKAAREIQECDALHQILFLILVAGNFLNSGGYAGNAAGFRVMSLLKVIELRSNRPGVSLLHYVAQQADRAGLVSGLSLATLEPACRVSGDQVRAEVGALADRLARLRGDAAAAAAGDQEAFLARTDALLAVWQLLASLCTHGEGEGLRRALSTLEQLAALQGQRGRLAPLAHALAQPASPQAALLTLANCALSSRDRARLRAELRARGVKVPPALGSSPAPTTPAPSKDSPLASSPALHRQALATLASLAAAGPNREAQLLRLLERLPTLADDAWEKLGAAEPTTRCDCTRQQAAAKETRASPSSCPVPPAAGPPPPPPPPPPQARQDELLELLAASPAPRVKMRSLNWTKIPAHKVLSGPNLWRRVAQSQSRPPELDFGHLEGLFCQPPEGTWPRTAVSRTGDPPGRTEAGEVRLLDAQRSLHLGIFLKQLRGQGEELLELLSRGGGGQLKLGAERVRSLLALLPASEAASQLEKALADAEPALLAPPEAFLARLLRLPNYRLRIESLLLQEELPSVVASLESSMTCLRKAAREIQECDALHQILFLILVAGNFLNSGGYAGNAAGFRVMSLLKVIELRSNRPGVSLLHYVAQQADRAGLVSGLSLATLEPACRVSGDQVRAEVGALADRLARLRGDAAAAAAGDQEAFLARTDALLAVLSGPNLWRRVAQSQSRPPELDFGHLEGLFCQPPEGTWPRTAVSRTGDPPGRTEAGEVRLLDAQRSLHLGIFLKQLRGQGEELLELLSRGGGGQLKLGAERVRSLLALLPASEAASQLEKALADAEPALLAPPEAFLARLLRLPNYRLRIESLLLQEELPSVVASLESSMTCLRKAAREIQECDALHQILFLILVAGNFLNSGGYAGNAAGFRVMSLLKVIELRSNRPGVSLLHYVAQQADRAGLVSGLSLATLEPACRVSGDQVRAEVGALADRLARLRGDAAAAAAGDQEAFLARTDALLALAQRELERLRRSLRSLDKARADLADFFCEDLVGFTLEECFRVLATFCRSFKAAVQDNQRRAESPLRCPAEVRLRDEHGGTTSASSPDASPSGSLRRSFRISRPSSRPSSSELGSEDQLMDFLRQSTSDREDSLGRRSRREARRRVAAETFDDGSRERVPSTDAKVTPRETPVASAAPATPPAAPAAPVARTPVRTRSAIPTMPGSSVGHRSRRDAPEKPFMRATSASTARSGPPDRPAPLRMTPAWRLPPRESRGRAAEGTLRSPALSRARSWAVALQSASPSGKYM